MATLRPSALLDYMPVEMLVGRPQMPLPDSHQGGSTVKFGDKDRQQHATEP